MVTGEEYIYDNIYQARDYILDIEKEALASDERRKTAPFVMQPRNFTHITVDSLDYPFSSYFNKANDSQFIMTRLQSGRYSLKPNLKEHKFLYRGESEYHPQCRANLFRDPAKNYFLDDIIHGDEMFRVILSHPLVQLLDLGIKLNGKLIRFEMNIYGLIQHYYNKSALLDLTSDINVALFFATQKYDWGTDTYSPIDNKDGDIGILYYYNIDPTKDFNIQSNGELLSTIGLQVFPRSGRQRGFLYQQSKGNNFNSHPQLSAFRFRHNAQIADEISRKMKRGKTLFPDDALMHHWRDLARKNNVVSEDAIRINLMRNPNESFESIKNKLNDEYNILVEDYKSVLTEGELLHYYNAVEHDNLWEEFCNQIFIPGDNAGKMMKDLLDVPNKAEYEWAFKKDVNSNIDYDKGYLLKRFKDILTR